MATTKIAGRNSTSSEAEQEPLLSSSSGAAEHHAAATDDAAQHGDEVVPPTSLWPVATVLIAMLLWTLSNFAPKSALLSGIRNFNCASYYAAHPELHDKLDAVGQLLSNSSVTALQPALTATTAAVKNNFCALHHAEIEAQSAIFILITDTVGNALTMFSILFFGQRLSTWGRKPILLLSFVVLFITSLPFLFMPLGYPFSELQPEEMPINPIHIKYILSGMLMTAGVFGGDYLALVVTRTLIVDRSTAAERTRNLTWLTLAYLCGIMVGPVVSGVLADLFPIQASTIASMVLAVTPRSWANYLPAAPSAHPGTSFPPPHLPPGKPDEPVPPMPPGALADRNVTPFIIGIVFAILACLWAVFFVAESKPARGSADDAAAAEAAPKASRNPFEPLRILLPYKAPDGTMDWRLTRLALVQFFSTSGGTGLTVLIIGCEGLFGWGPSSVGFMLSWVAGSRAVVLFSVVPLIVKALEGYVPRPSMLLGLPKEELERLAKSARADEAPGGADSAFAQEAELGRHEQEAEDGILRPLVVLWKTSIDLALARVSYFSEAFGYTIISLAAFIANGPLLILGSSFLSLGGGYAPAMQSASISIASDVFSTAPPPAPGSTEQALGSPDRVLSAFACIDTLVLTSVPILTTSLYAATIVSFPPACFLLITLFYALTLALLAGVSPHRSHSMPSASHRG